MRAFLAPSLPACVALVARLSRASKGRTPTDFRDDQALAAFPPQARFAIARLPSPPGPGWTEAEGLILQVAPEGVSPRPRPCTGHASFLASGAKCELPRGWRPRGVPLGEGRVLDPVASRGGYAVAVRSMRAHRARIERTTTAGSDCRTTWCRPLRTSVDAAAAPVARCTLRSIGLHLTSFAAP